MRELTERSLELRDTILRNRALLKDLTDRVAEVLAGKVELPEGTTYVFVPRVYRRPIFLPEIYVAATEQGVIRDRFGLAGPYDPWIVEILNQDRLELARKTDPTPQPIKELRAQILGNPELLKGLSTAIAEVLDHHGVVLGAEETYGFDAVSVEQPVFAGQVSATPLPSPGLRCGWRAVRKWLRWPSSRAG